MTPYAGMSKQLQVRFSVQGTIREDRQTKSFVSYCPALDLYSAGRTRLDAKKALISAVDTYVKICYERGILGRLLKQKGFVPTASGEADHPALDAEFIAITEHASEYDDIFDVEIPLHLVAQSQLNQECQP